MRSLFTKNTVRNWQLHHLGFPPGVAGPRVPRTAHVAGSRVPHTALFAGPRVPRTALFSGPRVPHTAHRTCVPTDRCSLSCKRFLKVRLHSFCRKSLYRVPRMSRVPAYRVPRCSRVRRVPPMSRVPVYRVPRMSRVPAYRVPRPSRYCTAGNLAHWSELCWLF